MSDAITPHPAGSPIEGTSLAPPDFEAYPNLSRWQYPYWAMQHGIAEALGPTRSMILFALSTAMPEIRLSVPRIARLASGVDPRTVQRELPSLEAAGLITWERSAGGRATHRFTLRDIRRREIAEEIVQRLKTPARCHPRRDVTGDKPSTKPRRDAGGGVTSDPENPGGVSPEIGNEGSKVREQEGSKEGGSAPTPPVAVGEKVVSTETEDDPRGASFHPQPEGDRSGESPDRPQPRPKAKRQKGTRSTPTAPPEALASADHYVAWLAKGADGLAAWTAGDGEGYATLPQARGSWGVDDQGRAVVEDARSLALYTAARLTQLRKAAGLPIVAMNLGRLGKTVKTLESRFGSIAGAVAHVDRVAQNWPSIVAANSWASLAPDESALIHKAVLTASDHLAAGQSIQTTAPGRAGTHNAIGENHGHDIDPATAARFANTPGW